MRVMQVLRPLRVAFTALSLLTTTMFAAQTELRSRSNVVGTDKRVHYELAEIVRLSDSDEANIVLVRDAATGDRYVLERLRSYTRKTSTWIIRDPKGEAAIQTRFPLPFAAKTRQEVLEEARENPALASVPTILTIETNGGTWSGLETSWDEWSELRKVRHDIRRATSFHLLEGIERMRDSVFAQPAGQGFYDLVAKFVVYDADDPPDARLRSVRAMPNCDFDRAFGFPCSDAQQKRVRKAMERGQVPDRY